MSGTLSSPGDAKASAAFARYAEACARLRETRQPADEAAARRACRRFLRAYLTPEECAQVEADIVSSRGGRQ